MNLTFSTEQKTIEITESVDLAELLHTLESLGIDWAGGGWEIKLTPQVVHVSYEKWIRPYISPPLTPYPTTNPWQLPIITYCDNT
jgi:hypothetical protein